MKALHDSTTLYDETKKRVEPLLTVEYMSSDETAIKDLEDDDSATSDHDQTAKKKKLIKDKLVGNYKK